MVLRPPLLVGAGWLLLLLANAGWLLLLVSAGRLLLLSRYWLPLGSIALVLRRLLRQGILVALVASILAALGVALRIHG